MTLKLSSQMGEARSNSLAQHLESRRTLFSFRFLSPRLLTPSFLLVLALSIVFFFSVLPTRQFSSFRNTLLSIYLAATGQLIAIVMGGLEMGLM